MVQSDIAAQFAAQVAATLTPPRQGTVTQKPPQPPQQHQQPPQQQHQPQQVPMVVPPQPQPKPVLIQPATDAPPAEIPPAEPTVPNRQEAPKSEVISVRDTNNVIIEGSRTEDVSVESAPIASEVSEAKVVVEDKQTDKAQEPVVTDSVDGGAASAPQSQVNEVRKKEETVTETKTKTTKDIVSETTTTSTKTATQTVREESVKRESSEREPAAAVAEPAATPEAAAPSPPPAVTGGQAVSAQEEDQAPTSEREYLKYLLSVSSLQYISYFV